MGRGRPKVILAIFAFLLVPLALRYKDSLSFRDSPSRPGISRAGLVFYDRWRAQDGYNVFNDGLIVPSCEIFAMDGRKVFEFPKAQCYFFRDGSVFFMSIGSHSQLYDSTGLMLWDVATPTLQDLDVTADESQIFLLSEERRTFAGKLVRMDIVRGYNRDGTSLFEWKVGDHIKDLQDYFHTTLKATHYYVSDELTHFNSVQVLPVNDLEKADPAFKHGNILVNCYINQIMFIIERESGKVVWGMTFEAKGTLRSYDAVFQRGIHSAKMLANGHILFFHNQAAYSYSDTVFSSVIELNPKTREVVWRYHASPAGDFSSKIWGAVYRLENGNDLISYSTAGSAFEVTHEGRLVWEWVNPVQDRFGLAEPFRSLRRVPRDRVEKALRTWSRLK